MRFFILRTICTVLGHPASTKLWKREAQTKLTILARELRTRGGGVTVSCICGAKRVPLDPEWENLR